MSRDEIPACRPCGDLNKRWKAGVAAVAEARRIEAAKPKPMCPSHPGQIAAFCGPCRSEQIGAAS